MGAVARVLGSAMNEAWERLPEVPPRSGWAKVLGEEVETLLFYIGEGRSEKFLKRRLNGALDRLWVVGPSLSSALLFRNLVERLLLRDHVLAGLLHGPGGKGEAFATGARSPSVSGVVALRLLMNLGRSCEPLHPFWKEVSGMLAPGGDGLCLWERVLAAPGGFRPQGLAWLPGCLELDPRWMARLRSPIHPDHLAENAHKDAQLRRGESPELWRIPRPSSRLVSATVTPLLGYSPSTWGVEGPVRVQWQGELPPVGRMVVFQEIEGRVQVLWPRAEDFAEFSRKGRPPLREREVFWNAGDGEAMLTLAIVPDEVDVDWTLPPALRWAPVLEGILSGSIPTASGTLGKRG